MGGAGGHMSHPYDLDEVKNGSDLIKVLMSIPAYLAMEGVVNATIKLDGSNNSVKVIDRRGKFEFALDRGAGGLGKGEMDFAGLTADDYEARGLNQGLQNSTNILLSILNEALDVANIEPELRELGLIDLDGKADLSKFLNTEFYEKENSNSIDYTVGNFISFHGVYQFYEKYHRRGQPDKLNPNAKMIRKGIVRPTYIDQKDNKEKFYKGPSVRLNYDADAMNRLVQKIKPFAKKRGFEIYGPAKVNPRTNKMVKEAIADMKSSLQKPITINFSNERSETKSLGEWANESSNPLTTKYPLPDGSEVYMGCANCLTLAAGGTTNPYNKKKVYEPIIIDKVPLINYFANSDGQVNALAALNSAILFHTTRLLGQDIKNHLTTEVFGDVTNHEGIVIRGLVSEDFKITGEFMVDDSGGFAQKRVAKPEAALEEEIEIIDDNEVDDLENLEIQPNGESDEVFGRQEIVAIVPGAFKPPHMGHLEMVRKYSEMADRVIILISKPLKNSRGLPNGTEITADHSLEIWNAYIKGLPNVSVGIFNDPGVRSPITAAYQMISDLETRESAAASVITDNGAIAPIAPGSQVILGASTKGGDWKRWDGAEKYVSDDLTLLSPEDNAVEPETRENGEPFSATDMRTILGAVENDEYAIDELEEFTGEDNVLQVLSILGIGTKAPVSEVSSGGTGGLVGSPGITSKKNRKKPKYQEAMDFSVVDEIMALIIERGTL